MSVPEIHDKALDDLTAAMRQITDNWRGAQVQFNLLERACGDFIAALGTTPKDLWFDLVIGPRIGLAVIVGTLAAAALGGWARANGWWCP